MNGKTGMAALLVVCVLLVLPGAVGALSHDPVPGIWAIDREDNGQAGRGFQIEIQNDILVLTFYGYDASGASTWWLATGKFAPNSNQITMELGAYAGGMAFGDPLEDAYYLGSDGLVTLSFDSNSSGTICLPREACTAISKLNFGYVMPAVALTGNWSGASSSLGGCQSSLQASFQQSGTNLTGTLTVTGGPGCYSPYFVTPVDGFVDGTSVVIGSVYQGVAEIQFKGTIGPGGTSLSGTWVSFDLMDAGNWLLQR